MTLSRERLERVAWSCVHFTAELGDAEAGGAGTVVREVDASHLHKKEELLSAVAGALEFPGYFGGNWDALDECLRDLSWLPAPGYALVVRDAEHLWRDHARLAGGLVEAWLGAAEGWTARETPFHLVFVW